MLLTSYTRTPAGLFVFFDEPTPEMLMNKFKVSRSVFLDFATDSARSVLTVVADKKKRPRSLILEVEHNGELLNYKYLPTTSEKRRLRRYINKII